MVARRIAELMDQGLIEAVVLKGAKSYRLSDRGKLILPVLKVVLKSGEVFQKAFR